MGGHSGKMVVLDGRAVWSAINARTAEAMASPDPVIRNSRIGAEYLARFFESPGAFGSAFGNALGSSLADSVTPQARAVRASTGKVSSDEKVWASGRSGGGDTEGLTYLEDGRVKLPSGRIVRPNVVIRAPVEEAATNTDGPVYSDSGIPVTFTGGGSGYIGQLRPYPSKFYAPGFSVNNGSVRLAVDGAHRIFNEVLDANGKRVGVFDPVEGQAKDVNALLKATFNPAAKSELLNFAAAEFATHTREAARLAFLLNPNAETEARLNQANAPMQLAREFAAFPLMGATAGMGAGLLPGYGYLAVGGSSLVGDTLYQGGNIALGNQQSWNGIESLLSVTLPVGLKYGVGKISPLLPSWLGGVNTVSPGEALRAKYSYMTAEQRAIRLEELAEGNAYRRLQELESSTPGAHFLEKHGAQTTLQSQLERAQYGTNPTTGIVETYANGNPKIPSSATRFLSNRDQLNAIERAQNIYRLTGDVRLAERPINFNYLIGEGYKKTSLTYGQSYSAQVWFRQGKVNTAFPIWGQ